MGRHPLGSLTVIVLAGLVGPILGLAGAGLGIAQQSGQDRAAKRAAAEQNKLAKEKADAAFKRAQQEYELSWQQNLTQYYWEQAQTEQLRKIEKQKAVDQSSQGARLIWGTAAAYQVNAASLADRFVRQEGLRGIEVSMNFAGEMQTFGSQMLATTAEAQGAISGYMTGIMKNGEEAQARLRGAENEAADIMSTLASQEMVENYKYNAQVLMAAMDGSVAANSAMTRSGGGSSAKTLALNSAKRALSNFAEVHLSRQARASQVGKINSKMQGEVAMGLAALATESAGYELQAQSRLRSTQISLSDTAYKAGQTASAFDKLVIPSFSVANDQYARELRGLQLGVVDNLYNATIPYREAQLFDPLRPIKGIAPTYNAPSPVTAQTGGFFGMANAALQGAQAFSPTLFSDTIPKALSNLFA
jgi:hypothetical protein